MTIPSLLLTLCVAVALGGWTLVDERTPRRVAIGIAIVSVLAARLARADATPATLAKLADQATFIEAQHKGLKAILDAPRAVEALQRCRADHGPDALRDPGDPLRDRAAEGGARGVDRPAAAARRAACC